MGMAEILVEIESIRKSYTKKLSSEKQVMRSPEEKIESLREKITKKYGEKGLACLNEILKNIVSKENPLESGVSSSHVVSASSSSSSSSSSSAPLTHIDSGTRLFQEILPLCQLACLVEQNGVPEEYAMKLSQIFRNEKEIYSYFRRFTGGKGNVLIPLFYNACKFELPRDGSCEFPVWKNLAATYMHFPRFRELLPYAGSIEKINGKRLRNSDKNHNKTIKIKAAELQKKQQEFRGVEKKEVINPSEEDKHTRKENLARLSQEISGLNSELVELAKGLPIKQAPLSVLQAFYEQYKAECRKRAGQIMTINGISAANQDFLFSIKRNSDDKAIPAITIKGSDIGYPGFYLMKLDTQTDEGAALAACLGKLTNCCQYLGGAGGIYVCRGIERPNYGFYVLFEGNENDPDIIKDKVHAQAFAWCSDDESICLDSLETFCPPYRRENIPALFLIGDMYRYFSMLLCEKKGIKRVTIGESSGTGFFTKLNNYQIPSLSRIDEFRDTDAKIQSLVADSKMPYLFYQYTNEIEEFKSFRSERLMDMIKTKTESFVEGLFSMPGSLIYDEELKNVLHYLIDLTINSAKSSSSFIETLMRDPLYNLMIGIAEKHHKAAELRQALVNNTYISLLNQEARTHARTEKGQEKLHEMLKDSQAFEEILKIIPESDRLDAFIMADAHGNNPLHLLCKYPESLIAVLKLMTHKQISLAISEKNARGETFLDLLEDGSSVKSAIMSMVLSEESQDLENIPLSSGSLRDVGFFSNRNASQSTVTPSPEGYEDSSAPDIGESSPY